ncbi:response regulator transcription factor [bacterium]|nr:response regulator transcription factor [bacterium]
MILDKLNEKNVKFTVRDSKDKNDDTFVEVIINTEILRDFILCLTMLSDIQKEQMIKLTSREKEVLKYLTEGKSNFEIAGLLKVSIHTAKAHIHNLYNKLDVQDRTQAVVKAIKNNLIEFN